jgi:hypothetical protein
MAIESNGTNTSLLGINKIFHLLPILLKLKKDKKNNSFRKNFYFRYSKVIPLLNVYFPYFTLLAKSKHHNIDLIRKFKHKKVFVPKRNQFGLGKMTKCSESALVTIEEVKECKRSKSPILSTAENEK